MKLTATAKFDHEKGTMVVDLDLVGHTEIEHEMLAAFFISRSVGISPKHHGDQLHAQFTIADPEAFNVALHNLENRKRKQDGRPSLEEEADRAKAMAAAPPPAKPAKAAKPEKVKAEEPEKVQ